MLGMTFDHRSRYAAGLSLLRQIGWMPCPEEMFKAPSRAKGSRLRKAAAQAGTDTSVDDALLAARIEHFTAVGGEKARQYFLSGACPLDEKKTARLSRRMPPFIRAKLEALYAGCTNVDSNPTGAFDTNGWAELRARLPKFAAALGGYAALIESGPCDLAPGLLSTVVAVREEAERLRDHLTPRAFPVVERCARWVPGRIFVWSKAPTRLAQVLGVLRKCNRDLQSEHWKVFPAASVKDLNILHSVVRSIICSTVSLLSTSP